MGVKAIIWEGELPENCLECKFGRVALQCTAVNRVLGFENDEKRPPWCPLAREVCKRCHGLGWITVLDDSSVDGLGSMDCPECGGRRVDIECRDSILVEREMSNESAS